MNKEKTSRRSELAQVRRPRVHLTYTMQTKETIVERCLPFVVGVLGDFSGNREKLQRIRDRRFQFIEIINFTEVLAKMQPSLLLKLNDKSTVRLGFRCLNDFSPAGLISQVPELSQILQVRAELLTKPGLNARCVEEIFRRYGLEMLFTNQKDKSIERAVRGLESTLKDRLMAIIHHPKFRALEAAWRALWYLVVQTETGPELKIELLDISKGEIYKDLKKTRQYDQSQIFKLVSEDRFGSFGGEPFGVLVGNFEFSHIPPDVSVLMKLASIAATVHAPFVAAASPQLFGMDDFAELTVHRDIRKCFQTVEHAMWRSFRTGEDSRWIALTIPGFLLRTPYHYQTEDMHPYAFAEDVFEGKDFLWGNAAFALATCMTRAFAAENWVSNITGENGGRVVDLPLATIQMVDGSHFKTCVSIAIPDRLEATLSDLGFAALLRTHGKDMAVFYSLPSCHKPAVYDDSVATGNARILSALPALLVCGRFAQYLKVISRDTSGSLQVRSDYESLLNKWLEKYVSHEPIESEEARAKFPLREGQVSVEEIQGQPGAFWANFYLRPQYGMEGLNVSFRLIVRL